MWMIFLKWLAYDAAQGELPAPHSLHQPHAQQGEQEVGEGGESGQPDRQPVVPHPRHLQDGGAVVPVGTQRQKGINEQLSWHWNDNFSSLMVENGLFLYQIKSQIKG